MRGRVVVSCTRATTRVSTSGSVVGHHAVAEVEDVARAGRRRRPSTRRVSASTTSHGAKRTAGSRLPCSARPGPTRRAASSQRHPEVDADDVGAGLAHQRRAAHRCRRRSGSAARPAADGGEDVGASAAGPCARSRPRGSAPAHESNSCTARGAGLDLDPQEGRRRSAPAAPAGRATARGRRTSAPWCARGPRRAALDQVARQGERRAGEADERRRRRARATSRRTASAT